MKEGNYFYLLIIATDYTLNLFDSVLAKQDDGL